MGSSLGPLLANIIMTELEEVIIKGLVNDNTIKFYGRYVDDTLLVIKPSDIAKVHELIDSFDPNIQFTVDTFENEVPHFLDIEISPDGLTIFRKDTNTGQYVNIESYTNWNHKTAWIRSLVTRAKRICSSNKLQQELSKIRCFASWNAFPKHVCNGIIKKTNTKLNNATTVDSSNDDNIVTLWMKISYLGDQSQQLVRIYTTKKA